MEAYQEKLFGGPEKIEVEVLDPRPDLIEDSKIWGMFLNLTKVNNKELANILHGFRCGGLRLHKDKVGYILRPEFNKDSLWSNQNEYERDREKWLIPRKSELIYLLNKL